MLKLIKEDIIKPITADEITIDSNAEEETAKTKEEVPENIINNVCQDLINGLIQTAWDFISQINSALATIDYDFKDENTKEKINELLNSVVDESTINIGILHKVFELLNNEKAELLSSGEIKAEKILDNNKN